MLGLNYLQAVALVYINHSLSNQSIKDYQELKPPRQ